MIANRTEPSLDVVQAMIDMNFGQSPSRRAQSFLEFPTVAERFDVPLLPPW
jgi:hypothetical protein